MRFKSMAKFLSVLALTSSFAIQAHALTDAEALAEGMTPLEEALQAAAGMTVNNPLKEEIEAVIQQNRFVIVINKRASGGDAQTLKIYENGVETLKTKVSTGREKTENAASGRKYLSTTPKGFFRPTKAYTDYLSYSWNAPMPNAVFFIGGIAIHATGKSHYPQLGTRASGGCVRTTLEDSKLIREKVMDTGRGAMAGMFKIINEAKGRNRVSNNTVSVPQLNRSTGSHLNAAVQSWDTVIVVHDQI
jgi:hypothetical protein